MAIIDVIKYNGTPDVFAWKYQVKNLEPGHDSSLTNRRKLFCLKKLDGIGCFSKRKIYVRN